MCLRRRKKKARVSAEESKTAVAEATRHMQEIQARGAEVQELAESLRDIRKRNHFAEQLMTMMNPPPYMKGETPQ